MLPFQTIVYGWQIFILYITQTHNTNDQLPIGKALYGYRRGHGFKIHSGLNFFGQALISQLFKLSV